MGGKKSKRGLGRWHIILLICVFMLAGLYLFETNSIVKDRFALEGEEAYAEEVLGKSDALEIEMSEIKALHNLEILSAGLDLENVKHVSYIEVGAASPLVLGN